MELLDDSGQKRDKWLILLMVSTATLAMSVANHFLQRERSREQVESDALATIDRLLEEFGERLYPTGKKIIAAIYIRYSTDKQDSFESQLRSILSYAADNQFSVSKANIFFDLGISGAKYDRNGLNAIREARREGRFQAFIAFSTSRLARNLKTLLEVLDEEFVGNSTRCVLVDQRLDSKDIEKWKMLLPLLGWFDEVQRTNQAGFVRSAHRNLLARRLCYSTTTYGFGGQDIPGFFTKRGRPVQLMVIDQAMAKVVRYIFKKFLNGWSIGKIVKRLNMNRQWPRPPKSMENRFSRDFVRRVLSSEAYLGVFVYDNTVDLSLEPPDRMRELAGSDPNVFFFRELKIISDEDFLKARERLVDNSSQAPLRLGRSNDGNDAMRPTLLNGMLYCPGCNNQLVVTGANGTAYGCKTCKYLPAEQQHLYSQIDRKLTTERIVSAICDQILRVPELMDACVEQCLVEIDNLQRPDGLRLDSLKNERNKVKNRLDLAIRNFQGEDVAQVESLLAEIRQQLRRLDTEIAVEQRLLDQEIAIPSAAGIRQLLTSLPSILIAATSDSNDDSLDEARELIQLLTGGRIDVVQQGEKKPGQGWGQARLTVDLAAVAFNGCGVTGDLSSKINLAVDITRPEFVNPRIEDARRLYDADMFEVEIADKLGVSRVCVYKWLAASFAAEGVEKPNGYQRRKRIEQQRGQHLYQQISGKALALEETGMLLVEIAEELKVDRNTVTNALKYAREQRDLQQKDGRARRKSLDRKSRD
jgi:DNA invertase Pin-like site-specific DNA recombinase